MTKIVKEVMGDDSVGTDQLEDDSVTNDKLGSNSVDTPQVVDDAITKAKMAVDSVGPDELEDECVTTSKYADDSLPIDAIPDGLLTSAKFANGAVTENVLGSQSVTQSKLGLQSVDSVHHVPASITSSILKDASVITSKIDDNAVTLPKIQKTTKGSLVSFDNDENAYAVAPGGNGSVLSMENGLPTWAGSILPTGTIIDYFGLSAPVGWLIANGQTIGSALSSANFSDDTTEQLFLHLWQNFDNTIAVVAAGRGASAGADWAANKTITIPNMTGRVTVAADFDSESPTGTITTASFASGVAQVGNTGGNEQITLTESQIPDHRHHTFREATASNPSFESHASPVPTSTMNERVSKWNGSISDEERHQHSYRMYYNSSFIKPTAGMTSSPVSASDGGEITPNGNITVTQPSVLVAKLIKL